jgi:hypothetical protein
MGQLMDLWSIMLHGKHGNLIGVLEGFISRLATLAIVVVDFSNGYFFQIQQHFILCLCMLQFIQY